MKFETKRLTYLDKVVWIDTETTGLDCDKSALIQIAALYEEHGQIKDKFVTYAKPHIGAVVSSQALKVNKITPEMLKDFPLGPKACSDFLQFLKKHIIEDDNSMKAVIAGFNVNFDIGFVKNFMKMNSISGYFSFFTKYGLDVASDFVKAVAMGRVERPDSYSLGAIHKHLGLGEFNAHDALSDIMATRRVYHKLVELTHDFHDNFGSIIEEETA